MASNKMDTPPTLLVGVVVLSQIGKPKLTTDGDAEGTTLG